MCVLSLIITVYTETQGILGQISGLVLGLTLLRLFIYLVDGNKI